MTDSTNLAFNGIARLSHLGVIRAEGEDSASFLQGQLTNDFALMAPNEARLAAYCTPKGRMQASFIGFKLPGNDIVLVMSRDILAPTLKRLSMFVMRAKTKLRDATAEFDLYGLAGETVSKLAPDLKGPWSRVAVGEANVVGLYPADGTPRALWVAPAGSPAPAGAGLDEAAWQLSEVRSGIATITAPLVEALVPQMLNYESVGGVNFKKGCYPGQEIVARSQFRGTLKRRAYLAQGESDMRAGDEVFHESDATQPCGIVAQAAARPGGGWDAIVSMQIAAAQQGALSVGKADGPAIRVEPAPYPLLADV
ncbi:MAG: folate-binding protein [Ramlibacter sp.]|nr:folate-binding protein [Ramlibacter sp.]